MKAADLQQVALMALTVLVFFAFAWAHETGNWIQWPLGAAIFAGGVAFYASMPWMRR